MYQPGNRYINNDYNCPSNELEIYDGGTSELINLINNTYESDFENLSDIALAELSELCSDIKSRNDACQIYKFLMDQNKPNLHTYVDSLQLED